MIITIILLKKCENNERKYANIQQRKKMSTLEMSQVKAINFR